MRKEPPATPPRVERLGRLSNEDNALSAALRFVTEVVTWLAIQRVWGWAAVIAAILVLALFNARGDKQVRGILVPGAFRVVLELGVMLLGVLAVWQWLGMWAGVAMALLLLLQSVTGWRRYRWLLRQ